MRRTLSVLFAAFAALLAACRGENPRSNAPEPVRIGFVDESAGSPREGGTLYRRLEGEPATLNPILQTSEYEAFVLAGVSRNLIDFDKAMNPVGGLCDRWEISPDQRVITLHLRPEAVWQDGSPVTAKDAVFTLEKIADPKSEALFFSQNLDSFQKAEGLDEKTFRVTFAQPYAYRLYAFNLPLLPAAIYANRDLLKAPENRAPVSNGPYRFLRWRTSESIELARNERYWGPRPHFDRVLFRIVPDQAQALRALERGDIDEMRLSTEQWKQARGDPRFLKRCRLVLFFDLSYFYIGYNNRSPLFGDAPTRRALTMLLDRGSLVRDLFLGTARVLSGPWAADSPAYDPSIAPYPFDPARAKQLLAEAGWKPSGRDGALERGGKRFEFDLLYGSGSTSAQQIAEVFRNALAGAGILCHPRAVEWAAFAKKMDAGDFDAVASSYSASDPNPDLFGTWHSSQAPPNGLNNLSYADPEADRLISDARLELDPSRRIALDHRLHAILHADEPATFAFQSAQKFGVSRRIGGLVTTPLGLFKFWPDSVGWWDREAAPAILKRYVGKRLILAVPTLAGVVLSVFLLLRVAPGDPASAAGRQTGRRVSPAAALALRKLYGLDRPLSRQIAAWFSRAARFDFGDSFQDHRPVSRRILEAVPYTFGLNLAALFLTLAIGIPLGAAQAERAGSAFDRISGGALFLLYSTPSFWVAMLLVTVFAVRLEWLPLFGVASDATKGATAGAAIADLARHAVLPLVCLTYGSLAFFTGLVRSSVREASSAEYVLAARARGASRARALWRHSFRNALLPLVTSLGLLLPGLLSGSVIVEQIFAWPGLGRLYFDAILSRDYPLILGLTFFTAVLTLGATLLADLLYAVADPRVKYE